MPEHPVLTAAARFRAQVLSREREAANRLVQTYGRAYTKMGTSIEALIKQVGSLKDPDRADVIRLAALRSLQSQVVSELNTFSTYADTEISRAATAAIQSGLLDSRALSLAAMGGTGPGARALAAGWDMLPTESVETMLGFLADDSPLHTALVNKLGPAVAQRMSDALVDGIALGMNPRKVAEIVRRELGVGLTWALTTARTAQINAYREAARANYVANSHIVGGWTWLSALGNRTCMSCLNMHGSFHPVTESLNDHHAGRCVPIPYVKQAAAFGLPQPEIEPGEQWFKRQSEDFQRERLGPGRFDAWKAGKFDFRDLSQPYNDPVYGEMLREASLKGLLTGKAKGKTLTFGTPAPERVEAVDYTSVSLDALTTTKEMEQWAAARYPNVKFDFEGALSENIRPTMAQFDKLATRYPEVAKRLEYVGTYKGENAPKGRYTNFNKENQSQYAHASTDGKVIGLNPTYYGKSDIVEKLQNNLETGWLDGDGSLESLMTHEFGHMVDFWLRTRNKSVFAPHVGYDGFGSIGDTLEMWRKQNKATAKLSKYATTHNVENFSEGFSAIHHKPQKDWPIFVKRMDELLREFDKAVDYNSFDDMPFTSNLPFDQRAAANRLLDDLAKSLNITR